MLVVPVPAWPVEAATWRADRLKVWKLYSQICYVGGPAVNVDVRGVWPGQVHYLHGWLSSFGLVMRVLTCHQGVNGGGGFIWPVHGSLTHFFHDICCHIT